MKHKQDAIDNSTRLIDLHREQGLPFNEAAKAALITAEESSARDRSLTQRTVNQLRDIVYGPEMAKLIHDKEAELQRAYGHRGFEYVEPDEEMNDDESEKEFDRQKQAYNERISTLKNEIKELKKQTII